MITPVSIGTAVITIKDISGEIVTLKVTIKLEITTPETHTCQMMVEKVAFTQTTDSTTKNDEATLGLVGTSAASSDEGIATAVIADGKIAITSVGAGTVTITVTDGIHEATIAVIIEDEGAISIEAITKYTEKVIDIAEILGVSAPVAYDTAAAVIDETEQYTGTVSWSPELDSNSCFIEYIAYTATITLIPKTGYTLAGVAANFFTVAGAKRVSNDADTGKVKVQFRYVRRGRLRR